MVARTLDIDERLLVEAEEAAGTSDFDRVVEMGLRELVRKHRIRSLVESFGTVDLRLTEDDLHRLRRLDLPRLDLDDSSR